jgi:hypothetical protein
MRFDQCDHQTSAPSLDGIEIGVEVPAPRASHCGQVVFARAKRNADPPVGRARLNDSDL